MSEKIFTPSQCDAMDTRRREQDTCVVAGPGSGKTTVLVEYFRRLVAEEHIDPLRILAITFTEKAAANMREKLAEAFADQPEIRAKLERAWVSTVHGFCARLLRENAIFAGVDPEFYVLDEQEWQRLQSETMTDAMEELFAESPDAVRSLLRGLAGTGVEGALLGVYEGVRAAGQRIEDLDQFPAPSSATTVETVERGFDALRRAKPAGWTAPQRAHLESVIECAARVIESLHGADALEKIRAVNAFSANLTKLKRGDPITEDVKAFREDLKDLRHALVTEFYERERWTLFDALARFDRLYRERKRQLGALDFTDLETYTVRLLQENSDVCARLQAQFDQVLMDEFQDTNDQQAALLRLVRPPDRFYAVGDINQSIYGFRHANPSVFRDYRDEVHGDGKHYVELADNFRSRPAILSAVETVLDSAPGIEPRALTARRKFAEKKEPSVELLAITGEDADAACETEARWVARRVAEIAAARPFREIAVLVRNTEVLGDFTRAFDEAGIPYLVNRGKGFYETREVADLTHLLRTIANPYDETSVAAVLRSPFVEVSAEAFLRLRQLNENLGAALVLLTPEQAGVFHPADRERLLAFGERLARWRAERHLVSFDRLLLTAMDECGYRCESGPRGAANVEKFLAQARAASPGRSLDGFVEELALVRASNPREPDAPPEDSANAVAVMTVHSAKGLEFPVVFVAAMQKGMSSDLGTVAFSPQIGMGARWKLPEARDAKNDVFQQAIRKERGCREEEEAHRLLYVAMTRAEDQLVLSFSSNGKKAKNWAELLWDKLALDFSTPREEIVGFTAPDGKRWDLRLICANTAPAAARAPEAAESAEPVTLLDRPDTPEQFDTNATVTGLTTFATCPRKYYLAGYLGFEGQRVAAGAAEAGAALPASEFGSQVHAILAGQRVPDADPEAVRLAASFGRSGLGRRIARAERVEREFDFLMAVEGVVVRGQIDLWFEEGGESVVVDYKTDAVTAEEARHRAAAYELQLRLYSMAVERATGRAPAAAFVHFLRPNISVPVDLSPTLLDAPENYVRGFSEAQNTLDFPINAGEHCRRCAFHRDLCPAE